MKINLPTGLVAVALAAIAGYSSLCAQPRSEKNDAAIHYSLDKLEITASKANGRKALFVVKNGGSSAVKVVKDYLPWNTATALTLVVVPLAKGARPLEAMQPIEDPRATVLEIAANSEIRGELDVSHFFPQWRELVKQDVLLVWSLSLYDVETGHERRFNGVIEYRTK